MSYNPVITLVDNLGVPISGTNPLPTSSGGGGGTSTVAGSGTAGTPTGGVLTVQGVAGGTSLPTAAVGLAAATLYSEAAVSRTATGTGTTQTWPATVTQAFIGVTVATLTGGTSPTLVVSLQQQDANTIWQTIAQSSTITAVGAASFSVGPGLTNGQMLTAGGSYRFTWTVTGGPATLTFQISGQGR